MLAVDHRPRHLVSVHRSAERLLSDRQVRALASLAGQFGTVEVTEDGTDVMATLTGWNWKSERLFTEELRFPSGTR